jgi:GWxTD domain-containing protein
MSLPAWNEIGMGLANHLWQSTVFMIAVGVMTLLFRRNSAFIRYRLWLIASVKFLIPLSVLVGIGTLVGKSVEWPSTHRIEQSQISFAFQWVGQPFVASPAMPPTFQSSPPLTAAASPLAAMLTTLWLIGAAAVLVIWSVKWIRTARLVGKAKPFDVPQTTAQLRIRTSISRMEPGVFGIFRPVLILPADVAQNLKESQLESIIAHEMIHVRGRDNLAAMLHTVVQAVFWFHPLVWWLGSKLVDEREQACDEAVLQLGFDRIEYAEGILHVCKSYLKAPACMAGVSGSNLKKRIEVIMENQGTRKLTPLKKLLLTIAGAGVLIGPVFAGMISGAQSPIAVVREMQLPVIESATTAALPVLSQIPAPSVRQTPAASPITPVHAATLPVIESATIAGLPVLLQTPARAPQDRQTANGQQKWLDDVSEIISDTEKKAFQQLTNDEQRQGFITNFWLARDPTPGTPANEFRDEYNSRVAYANEHFTTQSGIPGSKTDRGKMYILNGPPDEKVVGQILRGTGQGMGQGNNFAVATETFPGEIWRYRHINAKGENVVYQFVDRQKNGDYTLEYYDSAAANLK